MLFFTGSRTAFAQKQIMGLTQAVKA
ncbi:MAG: hypothetical protein JWR09_2231, partial [Mucilaginibacter sp.]|nr:hypothetical protein [Mucilaginibacter sp.]